MAKLRCPEVKLIPYHIYHIPIHSICELLEKERCEALPMFHAVTGCDYTSFFRNVGKKTFWKVWDEMPQLTKTLKHIKDNPESLILESPNMTTIQSFIISSFNKNCDTDDVNEARQKMFTTGLKSLESHPPTKNALYQHLKRALLAGAFMWKHCLEKNPNIPDPSNWGWEWNQRIRCWVPYWTDLQDVSKGCSLLVHYGCKKACKGNCKCFKMRIRFSPLCSCDETCVNNDRFY